MESRFINEPGDLACKLMAALQGANRTGADARCSANGTSSLFAFVKVAQATDIFGNPSFVVSVRTADNSGIEPIDSLQTKFELLHNCTVSGLFETEDFNQFFSIYPNPASNCILIKNKTAAAYNVFLLDSAKKLLYQETMHKTKKIDVSSFKAGIYFLKIGNNKRTVVKKVLIE